MKTTDYTHRFYRACMSRKGLVRFHVRHLETDLHIQADRNLSRECSAWTVEARMHIENYAREHAGFMESYLPLPPDLFAGPVVDEMLCSSQAAGTGPMAAVAGAVAQHVGRLCVRETGGDVIVENGGDIFVHASGVVTISIFAGPSPLSGRIGIQLDCSAVPMGVCTSSGTVGHSRSFGKADAVTVVAGSVPLADAVATGVGNLVSSPDDIEAGLEKMQAIKGISGGVIVVDDRLGAWGDIRLVPLA